MVIVVHVERSLLVTGQRLGLAVQRPGSVGNTETLRQGRRAVSLVEKL
jgi:hypothetical protein